MPDLNLNAPAAVAAEPAAGLSFGAPASSGEMFSFGAAASSSSRSPSTTEEVERIRGLFGATAPRSAPAPASASSGEPFSFGTAASSSSPSPSLTTEEVEMFRRLFGEPGKPGSLESVNKMKEMKTQADNYERILKRAQENYQAYHKREADAEEVESDGIVFWTAFNHPAYRIRK